MTLRQGKVERKTNETSIKLELSLGKEGSFQGSSGVGFLDHMLELLSIHSGFRLNMEAVGDFDVDFHHIVEDIGLCMGKAFEEAIGDKKGIIRYGSIILPMDEALVLCIVDISGRSGYYTDLNFPTEKIGQFDSQLVDVFWQAFAQEARITLHIKQFSGENSHHIAEATFKGIGRALRKAVCVVGETIPSSKGVL
ncbi:MAG: imidazoleglycerol-phosphate dehydratase HisB [Clostridia bacterium]|nr:imidazoleglycerol-phosphate dehydratase HisB [Clostridia bacterium]